MKAWPGLLLMLAACAAGAEGVYRQDQPEVLERGAPAAANPAATAEATIAKFAKAYQASGRPRVLVLWHRNVGDRVTDEQRVERSAVSVGRLARDNFAEQVTISWKGQPAQPVSFLPPVQAADYEAGLTRTFLDAGVRLVDRSMAIRMTALKATESGKTAASLDIPTLEAQTFASMADQVLQVQLLSDAESPVGWSARLTLIEVETGTMLADSLGQRPASGQQPGAARAQGERAWKATDKGFVAQEKAPSLAQLAHKDALDLMNALAR